MNGLVGYGSSSEDEDGDLPPTVASPKAPPPRFNSDTPATVNGTSRHEQNEPTSENVQVPLETSQGPMVGPAMPTGLTTLEYEEEDYEEAPSMSERDMLRYLTQPSRPMTSLPPEPSEMADPVVTAKFKRFLELKSKGVHFNEDLANKTSFQNPSLFSSLLERAGVSSQAQYSSTLPPDVFSIDSFPDWAYKESLLKSQQKISAEVEVAKKAQSTKGKRTIEFASAGRSERVSSQEPTHGSLSKRKRN